MFDRDEQEISQIIESGIEAILAGRSTLEQVLAEHPGQAEEIRGELEGALWLMSRQSEVEARPGFVGASRKRVIDRIKAEASSQTTRRAFFGFAWPQRLAFQWVAAAAVILIMLVGAGGIVTVSANSLPGDELYAVKRAAEQVAYTVTLSDVKRADLSAQFSERRLDEAKTLMAQKNFGAAASTLKEYERQVNQTIALLENISDTQAREKLDVAIAFKEDLKRQAGILADLQASAPPGLISGLRDAQGTVFASSGAAVDIIEKLPDTTATPTLTVTTTSTPVATDTPVFTETPIPTDTPEPTLVVPDQADPSETLTPGDPSSTPKPDRTPKPKNDPQPKGKKDNPPGKNK